MKKSLKLLLCGIVFCIPTAVVNAETSLPSDYPITVDFSNRDINRIVCSSGTINDLIFSKEKGMAGHFSGNSAFIKFKIEKTGDKYTYASRPAELFVVCNNVVYSLIVRPKNIPSVTKRLASTKPRSLKRNIAHYRNMPLEKKVLQIVKEAYSDSYPSDYKITHRESQVQVSSKFTTRLIQVVKVDGVGLGLRKFQITAKEPVHVNEAMFLSSSIADNIVAVAVEKHHLSSGQATFVFVVDQEEKKK